MVCRFSKAVATFIFVSLEMWVAGEQEMATTEGNDGRCRGAWGTGHEEQDTVAVEDKVK